MYLFIFIILFYFINMTGRNPIQYTVCIYISLFMNNPDIFNNINKYIYNLRVRIQF